MALPRTMKAVRFFEYGEPSVLKYMDFPMPEVGKNDVLIKVGATSINRFDLKMRRGQIPQIPGRDPFPMPFQPGRDVAGEVAAVGDKVTRFKAGDRVVGMAHPACGQCEYCRRDLDYLCINTKLPGHQTPGGYAEYVARPETEALLAPEGVPYEKLASCLWSYACVWNVVSRRGNLRPGQSVLITGASGGLGTAAVQLSRLVGASKIIATTGSPAKAERLKELGFDHVINYRDADAAARVRSLTSGTGVDLVIDLVGGEMFVLGLNCLRMNGTIVNVAGEEATNSIPMRWLTVMLLHRYVTIVGVRAAKRIDNETVLQFLGEGRIDPIIDRVMPLSEAAKAHEILEKQEQIGKIVLVP
ncbi:MAG TPA: zinc-binding dehydrogenase [Dehalococcoidales bacterium]|nr:zinc-binding dehydrogenase [Dehalococcoidales bacterium]